MKKRPVCIIIYAIAFFSIAMFSSFSEYSIPRNAQDQVVKLSGHDFTAYRYSITGDKLKVLQANYKSLIGSFHTDDGVSFYLSVYGKKSDGTVEDVTPAFDNEGSKPLPFPCYFGNIDWLISITGAINPRHLYIIDPIVRRVPEDNEKHLLYRWDNSGAIGGATADGNFNPVPPKVGSFKAELFKNQ